MQDRLEGTRAEVGVIYSAVPLFPKIDGRREGAVCENVPCIPRRFQRGTGNMKARSSSVCVPILATVPHTHCTDYVQVRSYFSQFVCMAAAEATLREGQR